MFRAAQPKDYVLELEEKAEDEYDGTTHHTLQRKACLVSEGPVNHKKDVFYVKNDNFDLNKTIFKSVSGFLGFSRLELKNKLGNKFYWSPEKIKSIEENYESFEQEKIVPLVKQPITPEKNFQDIINFMKNECNFNSEHADGSFMDHLYFCRDYSKIHYSKVSPKILFLHSIMGVGSNIFPMELEKEDKLKGLITDREFKQVEAFPSILRLLYDGNLFKSLKNNEDFTSIKFHRVIDNKEIVMTADELWIALNLQLIHQLDFLPCSNWCAQSSDPMFQVFIEIYENLKDLKKIESNVKFDIENIRNINEKDEYGMPTSIISMISKRVPSGFKRNAIRKSIQRYSKDIGHSLSFSLE